jgi:hypothetical protein
MFHFCCGLNFAVISFLAADGSSCLFSVKCDRVFWNGNKRKLVRSIYPYLRLIFLVLNHAVIRIWSQFVFILFPWKIILKMYQALKVITPSATLPLIVLSVLLLRWNPKTLLLLSLPPDSVWPLRSILVTCPNIQLSAVTWFMANPTWSLHLSLPLWLVLITRFLWLIFVLTLSSPTLRLCDFVREYILRSSIYNNLLSNLNY